MQALYGLKDHPTVKPTAMLADALATAAFVLGPAQGIALLERHGVDGIIYDGRLGRVATTGVARA